VNKTIGIFEVGGVREFFKKKQEKENRRMTMFILGVLFGSGLILAMQELDLQWEMHKQDKLKREQDKAIALLTECTCWSGPYADGSHAYYCDRSNA
jgi:hypothetical protein